MQLKGYISFLASDSLKGRFAGTHEGRMAADYIAGQMKLTGLQPAAGFDGFFNPFLYKHDTNPALYGKSYFKLDNDSEQNLFSRSDNFPFAQRKIIAHTIMATSAHNQFYYSVKDEPATLNYTFMQEIVQAIHLAIMPLLHENIKLKGKSYLAK